MGKHKEEQNVYQRLIERTVQCLRQYNPVVYSVDTWADEFLSKVKSENEQNFIRQVFYGTQRYEYLLTSFNECLFAKHSSTTNRQDALFYQVLVYLIVFRFQDLPHQEVKQILLSLDAFKLNAMLAFLFETEKLEETLKAKWTEMYDPEFIESVILKPLDQRLEESWFIELLRKIKEKATGVRHLEIEDDESQMSAVVEKKGTVIQEFNLTKPKAKKIPSPIKIEKKVKVTKVPETNQRGKFEQLQQEKAQHLQQTKEAVSQKYQSSKVQKFALQTEERPQNIERVREEVEAQMQKQLQFNKKHRRDMPEYKEEGKVRMTVGQILKEEKKIKEKQMADQKVLEDLHINLRDSSEFRNWKRVEEQKDEELKVEQQYRKKIEMELAREKAAEAQQEKMDENRRKAQKVKLEGELGLFEREQQLIEQMQDNYRIVEEGHQQKEAVRQQRKKVEEENKEAHDKQVQQLRAQAEKRKEEEKVENAKRDQLIKQIREFERQPKDRTKGFDITECQGWGLLEEMSILELRERLQQVKVQAQQEREEKVARRRQEREEHLQDLESKIQLIGEERQKRVQEKGEERARKKAEQTAREQRQQRIREEQVVQVQSKVAGKKEAKQKEEERLEKELKEIRLKRQYMNANKAKVEAQAWKNLQDGKEREIKERQNGALIEKEREQNRKHQHHQTIQRQRQKEAMQEVNMLQNYQNEYKLAQVEDAHFRAQDMKERKTAIANTQAYKQNHLQSMQQREPYKFKISQENLQRSKPAPVEFMAPPAQYAD